MKKMKSHFNKWFLCTLTRISPILNTKIAYFVKFKKKLDLNNPKTLNEKILWLKFNTYHNNSLVKKCADKFEVRKYIEECNCKEILNELLFSYDNPEKINWNELPNSFAIKLNIGCGYNIICSDKNQLNTISTISKLKGWIKEKPYLHYSEMQYKDVDPIIMVEKYLGDSAGNLPSDYKFYCINGEAKYVMVCVGRGKGTHPKFLYYDRAWNLMPFSKDALENPDFRLERPKEIDVAFEYAEKLSKPFPFVRTDLYIVDGKVYFGELTFTPGGGLDFERLKETDEYLGRILQLD